MRLNRAQGEAVEHGDGPLLVLAGAGSGKTRVITHRIARLVERGVPARAIVALTFTNKAAGEMRERVATLLGKAPSSPARPRGSGGSNHQSLTVSTFHSFGLAVLGREREAVGGRFTIFDQGDQTALVKQLLRDAGAERAYDAAAVLARISNAKNAFLATDDLPEREGDAYDEITKAIYPRYQSALRQYRAFDFDDLVCEVAHLWREREDIRARWQSETLHVLVDEYQDTNRAQLEMLRLLCGERRNVCAVGDDDQAIYGWRGADVRNILDFERHFDGARVVKLEQNYRSYAPILAVANAVIAKRTDSKWRKELFTDRAGGRPVRVAVAPTPELEAAWVGREIRRLLREEGSVRASIAVLYRSIGQSGLLEVTLSEQVVLLRVVGGAQFFERKEVKDVLAYLKLALNPADEISLRRVVNYPARGIGEVTLDRLVATTRSKRGWTLWQAIERVEALDDVPAGARDGCRVARARRHGGAQGALRREARAKRGRANDHRTRGAEGRDRRRRPAPGAAAKRWANIEGVAILAIDAGATREPRPQERGGTEGLAALPKIADDGHRDGERRPGLRTS